MHFKKIYHKVISEIKKFENRLAFFIFFIVLLVGFIMSSKDILAKLFANLLYCGFLAFIVNAIIQSIIEVKNELKKS